MREDGAAHQVEKVVLAALESPAKNLPRLRNRQRAPEMPGKPPEHADGHDEAAQERRSGDVRLPCRSHGHRPAPRVVLTAIRSVSEPDDLELGVP